ncbi:MAG: isochorismate synthase [Actinobacteria bacterium]|nr:isochorismate synthase [Actinomycetota bacterium]
MLIPRIAIDDLAATFARAPSGLTVGAAEVDLDPIDLVRSGAAAFATAYFSGSPDGRQIGGLGIAQQETASGADRLRRLRPLLRDLAGGATAMIGFSYQPDGPVSEEWAAFPSATAVVPQIAVVREAGHSRLVVAVPPGVAPGSVLAVAASLRVPDPVAAPGASAATVSSHPAVEEWREAVAEAAAAAAAGSVEKVVLARTVRVTLGSPISAFDLVALLRDRYPESRVYGWQSGDSTFIGASPELLVSRHGTRVTTVALAGSAARSASPETDRRLADALLASEKDRTEQAIVVDEIARRLEPLTEMLDVPEAPVVDRYATVQHLATPIVGRTRATVLELAEALHPTPAVGGHPSPDAIAFQSKLEQIDRGWYAGGIGWADAGGDGEIAVALRCALIRGERAVLYAGNGIVVGSDPDAEVEETRLKLRPLLALLTGS